MHHPTLLAAAGVAVLSALPGVNAGMYTKSSPVLQLDARSYDKLIANSNYTSVCAATPADQSPASVR